ncbi:hypothetical protein ATO13_23221 [Stappia sp. 22II-S9-Z10]|nr:hypothetical protein ATO13_23221 [Stappia sp. 22II-S9-Z10]
MTDVTPHAVASVSFDDGRTYEPVARLVSFQPPSTTIEVEFYDEANSAALDSAVPIPCRVAFTGGCVWEFQGRLRQSEAKPTARER